MMTADQCRAKAEGLIRVADEAKSYDLIIECEVLAIQWRWVADQAEWQDAWRAAHPKA